MQIKLSGVDLGSSAIRVIAAEVSEDGTITVTGRGEVATPPSATYMGSISNQEKCSEALRKVVEEVEVMAGFDLDKAFVGVSSPQFEGLRAVGKTHVQGRHRRVTIDDRNRVLDNCSSIKLPDTQEVFATIPMEYKLDGQQGILQPVQMVGHDLSVVAHIITCPKGFLTNVTAICNDIGMQVDALVYEPLGAIEAVVTRDEREMGFLFVDIGYDTTHVILSQGEAILYNRVIRVGGRHFTTDLAQVLGISQKEAESLKATKASLIRDAFGEDDAVELTTVGQGRTKIVTLTNISEILFDRTEELLEIIHRDLKKQDLEHQFKGGCIISGAGGKLDGMLQMVENAFNCHARVGIPQGILGLTDLINRPEWSTAVGVMLYGYKHEGFTRKKPDGFFGFIKEKFSKGGKR